MALFPWGETPHQPHLHSVLAENFPSLVCPSGHRFANKYSNKSLETTTTKFYVFKCGCGGDIELKVCFPVQWNKDRLLPTTNLYQIWRNTIGSPPTPCAHSPPADANDSTNVGQLSMEAEPLMEQTISGGNVRAGISSAMDMEIPNCETVTENVTEIVQTTEPLMEQTISGGNGLSGIGSAMDMEIPNCGTVTENAPEIVQTTALGQRNCNPPKIPHVRHCATLLAAMHYYSTYSTVEYEHARYVPKELVAQTRLEMTFLPCRLWRAISK